jgi:5'(3')-deoxyribonucleotidase
MNIIVDVDGTVADSTKKWFEKYNADYNDHLKPEDIDGWGLDKQVKPECGVKIYDYLEDPALYDDIEPIKDALMGVKDLRSMGHRVAFATSSPNGSAGAKLRWLLKHGFLDKEKMLGTTHPDYAEIHDKGLIYGDILIDDGPHNVQNFKGLGILFNQPHNRNFSWPIRTNSWMQIVNIIEEGNLPPGNHPTELRCPVQARAFKDLIEKMYQVHLDKNQDYSPANILGTGQIGLVTRLWDKIARLMNLNGFNIDVVHSSFKAPKSPKCESIQDTYMDAAVYAIIGMLLMEGKWGR